MKALSFTASARQQADATSGGSDSYSCRLLNCFVTPKLSVCSKSDVAGEKLHQG